MDENRREGDRLSSGLSLATATPRELSTPTAGTPLQIQPQYGNCFYKENGDFCCEPSPMSESMHNDIPCALHTPAGSPARCIPSRGEAQRSGGLAPLLPPLTFPAACSGVQDQGRPQEALPGLLPGEEAWAVVHLLQNEPKAQTKTDVAPLAVKITCKIVPFP